ncbi:hypothetical protein PVAG01_09539 [Phlyctema vagabunda]|uniref:MAPEG family protein n=1 Tax=Phlyctema vagabunda TaxID=108571 RepID=A0ABR4P820_9HELO
MSQSSPPTPSYALHSIVAAYGLALVPNYYQVLRMMAATGGQWSFSMPRNNMDSLKSKVPIAVWNQCYRARCAHINAYEGFPLFAAAMLAGTIAGLPTEDLNKSAAQYLGLRALYTGLYITTTSEVIALGRTSVWALSVGLPAWTLWKAGNAIRNPVVL